MPLPMRFLDAGDSGGGEGASDSADGNATDAGTTGEDGDAGTKTDDSANNKADNQDGDKDYEALYKAGQTELTDLTSKNEHLTMKLGKQSETVGAFKRLAEARRDDPRGLAQSILKDAGIDVTIDTGEKDLDLSGILNDEVAEGKLKTAIEAAEKRGAETVKRELTPQLNQVFEAQLREKYPDWDQLSDTREALHQSTLSKTLTYKELMQLAAQGMHMGEALESAGKQAIETYKKELAAKAAGTLDTGNDDGSGGKPKPHDPKDKAYFDNVIGSMKKIV